MLGQIGLYRRFAGRYGCKPMVMSALTINRPCFGTSPIAALMLIHVFLEINATCTWRVVSRSGFVSEHTTNDYFWSKTEISSTSLCGLRAAAAATVTGQTTLYMRGTGPCSSPALCKGPVESLNVARVAHQSRRKGCRSLQIQSGPTS